METRALLAAGWRVLAVDSEPFTAARFDNDDRLDDMLEVRVAALEHARLPTADLIHSSYALPFLGPADFEAVWRRIRASLAPQGWLAVDLFGHREDWAGQAGMSFHSRPQVDDLLHGLEMVEVWEEDADGQSFAGPKHWHVFHILARRPGPSPENPTP